MRALSVPLLCAVFLAHSPSHGEGAQYIVDVDRLVTKSDLVVVGTVINVIPLGQFSRPAPSGGVMTVGREEAHIAPVRLLKGSVPSGLLSVVFESDVRVVYAPGRLRMFFLAYKGETLTFTEPASASLPATSLQENIVGTVQDQVALLLAGVLLSQSEPMRERYQALDGLLSVKSGQAAVALRAALADSDRQLRLSVAGGLLALNDLSVLPVAEQILLGPSARQDGRFFRDAIAYHLSHEEAIPSLARLLKAQEPETRRAAALALRRIDSAAAIPALAEALDDKSAEVQFIAISGLSTITGISGHATTLDRFNEEGAAHLAFWRNWATQRGLRP